MGKEIDRFWGREREREKERTLRMESYFSFIQNGNIAFFTDFFKKINNPAYV